LGYLQTSNFYKAEEYFSRAFKSYSGKVDKLNFESLLINNKNINQSQYFTLQNKKFNFSETNKLFSNLESNLNIENQKENNQKTIENNLNNFISSFDNEELQDLLDLSTWESGLSECYRNTNNWENLLSLSEATNNLEIKIESLWHLEKWNEIGELSVNRLYYLSKLNQIYNLMKLDNSRTDTSYQSK